jgi:bacterioferritin (cytochrome b1)
MYIKEFIKQLNNIPVVENIVAAIQEKYHCDLCVEAKRIVSFSPDGYFFDDENLYRILAVDEIIKATEELHVDFIQKKLLPLIDTGENNFIAFDCEKDGWCKFNIVDEAKYHEAVSISEYFK